MNPRAAHRRPGDDGGSATAEFAIMVPALVLLALLALLAHHVVAARMGSDTAAHAAARAATLERTPAAAHTAAETAVEEALRTHDVACADYDLALDTAGLAPGATVTATVSCTADLSQLTGLGLPGTTTVEGDATSVVDTYRSTP
ncbi:pilus assembly protein [Nocardiopsis sp. HNM0947]|uniref:Pilus assembly protein n=1 Tax=Nocardiopsis coralli TaxID=2772213 RepID=A0ABR9P006_9ACTN|nr:TadE/TadG family type IV pilus assembly protein [Nocardiopsis coralli]MBE2997176.1 pilus assembly protein [Nocardiopsis coralli]